MKFRMPWHKKNQESVAIETSNTDGFGSHGGGSRQWSNLVGQFNGDKTSGGFGFTIDVDDLDYYELREKSLSLYYTNPYARGIINRLLVNSVGAGLIPESQPNNTILKLDEKLIYQWTEEAEALWESYASSKLGDYHNEESLNDLQLKLELNSLLTGDVLVVERLNEQGLPTYQFIDGRFVSSPMEVADENIVYGVKLTKSKKVVSYFVEKSDGSGHREIKAYSSSGRRQAWLAFGSKRRVGEVRGYPLLMSALQALKQLDRYTDSEITASELNASIVGFIKNTQENSIGASTPFSGGVKHTPRTPSSEAPTKTTTIDKGGIWMEGLNVGEEPVSYDTRRPNVNHATFVRGVLSAISFSLDMPPEILFLEFDSSYSAARQVNNEFSLAITEILRPRIISNLPQRAWETFITYQTLVDKLSTPNLYEALKNESLWEVKQAWLTCAWMGPHRKPVDPEKEAKANEINVDRGWKTNQKASIEASGQRFNNNVKRIKGEKELASGVVRTSKESSSTTNKAEQEPDDE